MTARRGLLVVVLLAATPGGARADDDLEVRRASAKRLKDEGAAALERGDAQAALLRFREAYPSPGGHRRVCRRATQRARGSRATGVQGRSPRD